MFAHMGFWLFDVFSVSFHGSYAITGITAGSFTDRASPLQVDVRALKELLWRSTGFLQEPSDGRDVSFQDLIADVPPHSAAGKAQDLSVHLCFICLLHLANEHGLAISGTETLDQLVVTHPGS